MANPFLPSKGSNPFLPAGSSSAPKKSRGGVLGLVGNLAGDIKDAVVGLPTGLVMTVKDPIKTAKVVAGQEWQTWSPLFKGNVGEFLHQTYDHPLAPLLDVMTVFTLGAGAAARGASVLETVGAEGRVVKGLSGLRRAKAVTLSDPTNLGRHDVKLAMSPKAGRRAVQELKLKALAPHLPKWWGDAKYERAYASDMAHRVAATHQIQADSIQAATVLNAGKVLSDPKAWGEARQAITSNMWQGLDRHAPKTLRKGQPVTIEKATGPARSLGNVKGRERFTTPTEKVEVVDPLKPPKLNRHEAYIIDPEIMRREVAAIDKPEDFEAYLRDYGNKATTRDISKAYRRDDGSYPVVPKHDATTLGYGLEAARSSKAARWLWEKPTRAWKIAMVGYAPRTIVNNGIGNWLLYSMRQGGDSAVMGLYDAIRVTKGERYAKKLAAPQLYGADTQHWAYKWHMDELGNTFAHASGLDGATAKTRIGKRLSQGLYPFVHATSDKPVRLATLTSFYRSSPEVSALMKKGYKFDDAVEAAVANNPDLRVAASARVRSVAGDYVTHRGFERTLSNVIPFYLWDRHIVKTAGNMVADQPGRVAALQKISNMGEEETKRILGDMPEFLKGALPLELLGLSGAGGDRANILLTQGMNPYATLAELSSTGEALTTGTGESGLGAAAFGANPLITGFIESVTGRSLLTGAPVKTRGGVIPSVLSKTLSELPYPKVAEAALSPATDTSPAGNPYLYRHDVTSPLTSLLGIPIRSASKEASARLVKQQDQPRF